MLVELGLFALVLALLLSTAQAFFGLAGPHFGNRRWMDAVRPAAVGQWVFIALSFGVLAYAFFVNDFSVLYVANNSNSALPAFYRFTAVWGAHEGSLLLWALALSSWSIAVAIFSRNLPATFASRVLGVLGFVSIGFQSFILFTSSPFERLIPAAMDGQDLNPLLQDPALAIHPPMLYLGYVGFSVAFAFAVAALLEGKLDEKWARWTRPWTTVAWMMLTGGIALGSWWAYYELGWGGWWFWDPVENASFMPWLVGTALLHSLAVTEKRGLFKSWTLLLSIIAFSLSLLGTFLVRSGVLVSVHAFASDPSRGLFILGFLGACVGGSLALFAWRGPQLRAKGGFDTTSRESFLLFNNVLLLVAALLILIGTLYPLFLDALNLGKISVGPPYFNVVFLIPAFPLLALLAVGMHSMWKQGKLDEKKVFLLGSLGACIVLGVLIPIVAYHGFHPMASIGLAGGLWVIVSSLYEPFQRLRKKQSLSRGVLGMTVAHVGVGLFAIGVTVVQSYRIEKDFALQPGESVEMQGYTFKFDSIEHVTGPNWDAEQAHFTVMEGDKEIAKLHPQKRVYRVRTMPMTEAGIEVDWNRDLFVAMGEDLGAGKWSMRLQYKPMVRFIWFGAFVMALGGLIAITDRRYRTRRVEADERVAGGGTVKAT
ncbi:MAG TPA: heme lyase CcmF/NrfE family subunit [Steroidobacteraceae bacterium]|nr:heme lyase CcmF/NrfE family subunit [Steroidobacteraceae bacterium]